MNQPAAHQLYPVSRTSEMSTETLGSILALAQYDLTTDSSVYYGMTREETIATAQQTAEDVAAALRAREGVDLS